MVACDLGPWFDLFVALLIGLLGYMWGREDSGEDG